MGRKKIKQQKITQKPNQAILDTIGSPNPWTPAVEEAWMAELNKMTSSEIYASLPPMRKPPSVRKRG